MTVSARPCQNIVCMTISAQTCHNNLCMTISPQPCQSIVFSGKASPIVNNNHIIIHFHRNSLFYRPLTWKINIAGVNSRANFATECLYDNLSTTMSEQCLYDNLSTRYNILQEAQLYNFLVIKPFDTHNWNNSVKSTHTLKPNKQARTINYLLIYLRKATNILSFFAWMWV